MVRYKRYQNIVVVTGNRKSLSMMFKITLLLTITAFAASDETGSRTLTAPVGFGSRTLTERVGSSRIIHGEEANPGEFPHQAALLHVVSGQGRHMCGASVIAQDWVLTAAHCVDGSNTGSLAIVVDLHDYTNPGNYIWFNISSIIMHRNYNKGSGAFPNDVALLRLTPNGYDISKNIIKIASGSDSYAGKICTISGWGVKADGTGASKLKKAEVSVLSKSECVGYWQSNILDQHICVKGYDIEQGRGSCNGDSGGPLVCSSELDGEMELAGVTSWGLSGCHQDGTVTHPSVYARVTYFYNWVNENCGYCNV